MLSCFEELIELGTMDLLSNRELVDDLIDTIGGMFKCGKLDSCNVPSNFHLSNNFEVKLRSKNEPISIAFAKRNSICQK